MQPELDCSFYVEDTFVRQKPKCYSLVSLAENQNRFSVATSVSLRHQDGRQKPASIFTVLLRLHLPEIAWASGGTGEQSMVIIGSGLESHELAVPWCREQGRRALEAFISINGVQFRAGYGMVDKLCRGLARQAPEVKILLRLREIALRRTINKMKASNKKPN